MKQKRTHSTDHLFVPPPEGSAWEPSYTIQEASRLTQVAPYMLRYWESRRLISPSYTTNGHRRFRQADIERILKVKDLIYVKGMRAEGARKALAEESRKKKTSAELPLELTTQSAASAVLEDTKSTLREMLHLLR